MDKRPRSLISTLYFGTKFFLRFGALDSVLGHTIYQVGFYEIDFVETFNFRFQISCLINKNKRETGFRDFFNVGPSKEDIFLTT